MGSMIGTRRAAKGGWVRGGDEGTRTGEGGEYNEDGNRTTTTTRGDRGEGEGGREGRSVILTLVNLKKFTHITFILLSLYCTIHNRIIMGR